MPARQARSVRRGRPSCGLGDGLAEEVRSNSITHYERARQPYEEAVQNAERQRGHGKKVHRRDGGTMMAQKDQPPVAFDVIQVLGRNRLTVFLLDPVRQVLLADAELLSGLYSCTGSRKCFAPPTDGTV